MTRRAGALCALALVAACGRAPAPAAPEAANLTIGPGGAAGITRALPMTVEALAGAAPSFIVREDEGVLEGQSYRMLTLSAHGEVVFEALPAADGAHLQAIVTRSPQARGPAEDIVDASTFGDAPAAQVLFCAPERVAGAPGFACAEREDADFWRVYQLPRNYRGPTDPFARIAPDAAVAAKLVEMRWIAPPAGDTP